MQLLPLLFLTLPLALSSDDTYRRFDETTADSVKEFYKENHARQTYAFVTEKQQEYLPLRHFKMDIWKAISLLDTIVDESDPDIHLPQSYHCFQTAEAIRKDGHPRWLIAVGFIHDLGKILTLFNEPQWAVVGDTFPVGCAFSDKNVFPAYFEANPDFQNPLYKTTFGIYNEGCGFDNLTMSWGHDEYLYQVVKDYLPEEGSYVIRYHSFYPAHHEGAYTYFMNEKDKRLLPYLKLFSRYDLYSKNDEPLDIQSLMPYYKELMQEFFPEPLSW